MLRSVRHGLSVRLSVSFNLAKRNSTIAWTCPIHPCTYLLIQFSIGHSPILLCNSAHIRQKWSITVPCSVLYGTSQASIDKLQRVQNIPARVAVGAPWTSSSFNIRRDLHWLPVGHRITYKLCLTTWKTLHTSQPLYLSELISHYLSPRSLRSSNTNLLTTLPDQPVLLATFPLGPFLCLYLLLETLHLHTFVLSIP